MVLIDTNIDSETAKGVQLSALRSVVLLGARLIRNLRAILELKSREFFLAYWPLLDGSKQLTAFSQVRHMARCGSERYAYFVVKQIRNVMSMNMCYRYSSLDRSVLSCHRKTSALSSILSRGFAFFGAVGSSNEVCGVQRATDPSVMESPLKAVSTPCHHI